MLRKSGIIRATGFLEVYDFGLRYHGVFTHIIQKYRSGYKYWTEVWYMGRKFTRIVTYSDAPLKVHSRVFWIGDDIAVKDLYSIDNVRVYRLSGESYGEVASFREKNGGLEWGNMGVAVVRDGAITWRINAEISESNILEISRVYNLRKLVHFVTYLMDFDSKYAQSIFEHDYTM